MTEPGGWRPLATTRARVVVAFLSVTAVAVLATAWLATRSAEQAVRANATRSLEDDAAIYQALIEYGNAHVSWDGVEPLLVELADTYGRRVAVAENSNRLLADSDRAAGRTSRPLPNRPSAHLDPINPVLSGAGAPIGDTDQVTSPEQVTAVRRCLTDAGFTPVLDNNWIVTVEQSENAVNATNDCYLKSVAPPALLFLGTSTNVSPLAGPSVRRTLLLAGSILLVAAALAWWLAWLVTRPFKRLAAAAGRLEGGDWETRLEESGSDEVRGVARSFNSMTAALQRNEAQRRQMVSDVAHELGNPLVTIAGTLDAIEDGIYEPSPAVLGSLSEDVAHLTRLVRDLQDLATVDSGGLRVELRPLQLGELVSSVVDAYRPLATASAVSLSIDTLRAGAVLADASRLRQMLDNLLTNAIRHTPSGGAVTVVVEDRSVAVSDSGEGIAADHLAHVFDRFWHADTSRNRATGGTGLGLAITRELAIAHGASLTVTSTLGVGTTFTIANLPVAP